jgi:hypothetical protein
MGSGLSQKLVSTTATATNSNTTVRFSGLEATATAAAATATTAGQQQADPAATSSHSSQGRISNIEKIFLSVVHKVNIFLEGIENFIRTGVHTEKVPCQCLCLRYFLLGFGLSMYLRRCFLPKKYSINIFAYFYENSFSF